MLWAPWEAPITKSTFSFRIKTETLASAGAIGLPELLAHRIAGDDALRAGEPAQAFDGGHRDALRQAGGGADGPAWVEVRQVDGQRDACGAGGQCHRER